MNRMNQFTIAYQSFTPETAATAAAASAQPNPAEPTHPPFEAPTLTKHGSVAALTQDFGGSFDPGILP